MATGRLLLAAALLASTLSAPAVDSPWGRVSGVDEDGSGRTYNAYLNLPYALPPLGERRWRRPERHPGPGVGNTFDGSTLGKMCPQVAAWWPGLDQLIDEDCLTLNIFTPQNAALQPGLRKVMVNIHGGAFYLGGALGYTPGDLVTQNDVIVVVVQYRLGVLGFLASGDDVAPGNYGLWDQNMALQWVQENIRAFGGDPDAVTIMGESAGSASVGYQVLSPRSKGLFARAAMQSGTPIESWAVELEPARAFKWLANGTGCTKSLSYLESLQAMFGGQQATGKAVLDCLRGLTLEQLKPFAEPTLQFGFNSIYPFVPVVDGDFVPRRPGELIEDAEYLERVGATKVDILVGVNNQENGNLEEFASLGLTPGVELSTEAVESILTFSYPPGLKDQKQRLALLTDTVLFYYLKPLGQDGKPTIKDLSTLSDDISYKVGTVYFLRGLAEARSKVQAKGTTTGSLYFYYFNHFPEYKAGEEMNGLYHAEDLNYLWDGTDGFISRARFTAQDFALGAVFRQLYTDFAKTGVPNVVDGVTGAAWPQFREDIESYLSLSPNPRVERDLHAKRTTLWLELLPDLYNQTEPTSQWTWPWQQQQHAGWVPFKFRGTMKITRMDHH